MRCWFLALSAGCGAGIINTEEGSDRLRTAVYMTEDDAARETRTAVLLLANSELDCDLRLSGNANDLSREELDLLAGTMRENARVVLLWLYRHSDDTWPGTYAVVQSADERVVDRRNRYAGAAYWGVNESVVAESEGLSVTYMPGEEQGDVIYSDDVGGPGTVVLESDEEPLRGRFQLDAIDVSGRFKATRCGKNSDLFDLLELGQQYLQGEDTGIEVDSGTVNPFE